MKGEKKEEEEKIICHKQ